MKVIHSDNVFQMKHTQKGEKQFLSKVLSESSNNSAKQRGEKKNETKTKAEKIVLRRRF